MTKENPKPCEHDSEWIEDKREGLHCCLCGYNAKDLFEIKKLYANNLHYVVCNECLFMLKNILSSQNKKEVKFLDELEVYVEKESVTKNGSKYIRVQWIEEFISSKRKKLK